MSAGRNLWLVLLLLFAPRARCVSSSSYSLSCVMFVFACSFFGFIISIWLVFSNPSELKNNNLSVT